VAKLIEIFDELINASTIEAGKSIIEKMLDKEMKSAFDSIDFKATGRTIQEWFLDVVRKDPPPQTLRGLHFGLLDYDEGCLLYVYGLNEFDKENSEWADADNCDWFPDSACLYLTGSNTPNIDYSDCEFNNYWWSDGKNSWIEAFSDLYKLTEEMDLDEIAEEEIEDEWQIVLAAAIISLNSFMREINIREILKNKELNFSIGFDHGDLYILNV
jgi:hypothetical protein